MIRHRAPGPRQKVPRPRLFWTALAFGGLAVTGLIARGALRWSSLPRPAPAIEDESGREPSPLADLFWRQRAYPSGTIDESAQRAALAQARSLRETRQTRETREAGKAAADSWLPLGPSNVGGRVTDIVADPANANVAYIGAASGGVWKTTDAGATWAPLFDDAGSLAIGALAMDPSDASVVYAGTGEANAGGGSLAYPGDGIWKTTDGGATWAHLGLDSTSAIGRIAIDPQSPGRVFVAACGALFSKNPQRGLYRSIDFGATWERVLFLSDSTGCVDVAIDPATPSRLFAAMWERKRGPDTRIYGGVTSGLYRSTDGGDSWNLMTWGLPSATTKPGRIGVAVAPSNPSVVYAVYTDSIGNCTGLYRSTDAGETWPWAGGSGLGGNSFYGTFGWWFGRLYVDPTNSNKLFASGFELKLSTNGGINFSDASGQIHPDHHAMWIQPSNPNIIWEGNDGGVFRSTTGGPLWAATSNLPITQFYTNEVSPSQPARVFGGTQDNGMLRTLGGGVNLWSAIFFGDGQYVVIDPNDPNLIYAENPYGNLYRSTDGGGFFMAATGGIFGGDRRNWTTPVVVDPASAGKPTTTLYYGAYRLYRSTNSALWWSAVSPDLSDGFPGTNGVAYGTITTIAVAPSDSATIYVGTDDANVWVSTDAGAAWTKVDDLLPERWVTRVAVDPVNDAIAYATFSGFRDAEALPHVFRTTDWGASWSSISGNLPEAPVNDIVIDPTDAQVLYVATDVGVFVTQDLGENWAPLGSGMPIVVVTDLDVIGGDAPALYAATYGRSMYRLDLGPGTPVSVSASGGHPGATLPILSQNAPNPVVDATRITFTQPRTGIVRLDIFDLTGERVRTIASGTFSAGPHEVVWDGRDARGRAVASGTYVYLLETGGSVVSRKLVVVR